VLPFAIRRLVLLAPVFVAVSLVIFMIIHLVPGDPLEHVIQVGSSPEQQAQMIARYGLDQPLIAQYWRWLGKVLRGDLGDAIVMRQQVARLIAENMPHSLALGGSALLFSTVVGITVGVFAASFRESWFDRAAMGAILLGSTLPSFWLALLMILMFAVQFEWFPVSGARSWDALVLPVLTIGIGGTALIARVTRAAMIETMSRDFVRVLHAKGVPFWRIQFRHVLQHAMMPVMAILGLRIGWILGGAVTVEFVFARPGLGSLLITALGQRDYPLVQGCLLMLAIAVMLGTLIGDLAQAALDPRLREAMAAR
jgi:ABC-type dipeptide/oligopeptide/nickel transport system permease component